MKVLQINQTYRNGGSTGRIAYELLCHQLNAGMDGFVVYGYSDGEAPDSHALCLQRNTLRRKFNILRTRLFDHHGFYNETETKRVLQFLDDYRPDIIHLHNIHNHYIHVGRLFHYIKENDIPVVWTLHDCWPFTGHCAYFDYANCDKWKTVCRDCPSLKEYPPTWLFGRTTRNYNDKKAAFCGVNHMVLVTPSQWLADIAGKSFMNEYSIRVINNGVDVSAFCPKDSKIKRELGIEGKKMILAMATIFDRRKGVDYLNRLPSMLDDNEVLVLVGLSKEQKKTFAQDKCIGLGRTHSVEELADYYSAADVFINPTLEDNFPTTNLEALACGTPVVTFKTGGSPESIDETVGRVVEKGNLNGLLKSIREVLSIGKDAFISHCVEKARCCYNKDIQYLKYIELYKEVYNLFYAKSQDNNHNNLFQL